MGHSSECLSLSFPDSKMQSVTLLCRCYCQEHTSFIETPTAVKSMAGASRGTVETLHQSLQNIVVFGTSVQRLGWRLSSPQAPGIPCRQGSSTYPHGSQLRLRTGSGLWVVLMPGCGPHSLRSLLWLGSGWRILRGPCDSNSAARVEALFCAQAGSLQTLLLLLCAPLGSQDHWGSCWPNWKVLPFQ